MKGWLRKIAAGIERNARRGWFVPLVTFLAALDAYVVVVPNEVLLVPAILARKAHWVRITLAVTLGSAIGAASFAYLAGCYGVPFVHRLLPGIVGSQGWHEWQGFIGKYGVVGLGLVSLSPFPQHIAVALVGLGKMKTLLVFLAVFFGRAGKYLFVSWAAISSPDLLRRMHLLK